MRRDIVLIEGCIGAGECAISDHRGSQADTRLIAETAAECRVGGMLAGKAGVMYCHMGPGPGLLEPLRKVTPAPLALHVRMSLSLCMRRADHA